VNTTPTSPSSDFSWLDGRILFLGDSVTMEGTYVSIIEYELQKTFRDRAIDLIGLGLSSETASGLSEIMHEPLHGFVRPCVHQRLRMAMAKAMPSVVVACYGMNDGIYHPQSPARMQAFQDGILRLIADSQAAGATVLLLTPPPFDPLPIRELLLPKDAPDFSYRTPFARYDTVLQDYSRWITGLNLPGVRAVDLNTPLTDYLKRQRIQNPDFCFSRDGIHPSPAGHLLMARTVLRTWGLPIPTHDLERDLLAVQSDPLFVLVDRRRRARSDGWLNYVGYPGIGAEAIPSIDDTESAAATLQAQIHLLAPDARSP
jgi:lysophospholipase L1-like esterase